MHKLILLFSLLISFSTLAHAHEIRPAVADVVFTDNGFEISIDLNLETLIAQIEPDVADTAESANAVRYDALRAMSPYELEQEYVQFSKEFIKNLIVVSDGQKVPFEVKGVNIPAVGDIELPRDSVLSIKGETQQELRQIQFGWAEQYGPLIIRVTLADGQEGFSGYVESGNLSEPITINDVTEQSFFSVLVGYIVVGFDHILPKGLDHILFVVGLFLLSPTWRPLLWQVSAFTLAHTITLALGMVSIVNISPSIVEPLIALSIVYVAVENTMRTKLSPWRPALVFAFGLLHGLGFAGVLTEFGIAQSQFVPGLIGFNVGVELGQLTVIAICFVLFGYWFGKKPWYRSVISIPLSLGIAAVGLYWFVERTFL